MEFSSKTNIIHCGQKKKFLHVNFNQQIRKWITCHCTVRNSLLFRTFPCDACNLMHRVDVSHIIRHNFNWNSRIMLSKLKRNFVQYSIDVSMMRDVINEHPDEINTCDEVDGCYIFSKWMQTILTMVFRMEWRRCIIWQNLTAQRAWDYYFTTVPK